VLCPARCIQMVFCPNPNCTSQGKDFARLSHHYRYSPACKPAHFMAEREPESQQPDQVSDLDTVHTVFCNKFQSVLMKGFNDRHYFNYVKAGHLDHVNSMMMEAIMELEHHAIRICGAASSAAEATARLQHVFKLAQGQISKIHSAKARTSYNKNKAKAPYVEPKLYRPLSTKAARKGAVRFSLIELYTRIMQRDQVAQVRSRHSHTPAPLAHTRAARARMIVAARPVRRNGSWQNQTSTSRGSCMAGSQTSSAHGSMAQRRAFTTSSCGRQPWRRSLTCAYLHRCLT
jgi:hypothetical protein